MAKINVKNRVVNPECTKNNTVQGKNDSVLSLISSGLQDVRELAGIFDSVNLTLERRKTTYTDNAIKLSRAENDVQKEKNRHDEEMAKIENDWKKISDTAADRDRKLSFIQGQIERFQAEYDKYMALETKEFLSDTVTSRLESLRKVIMDLTKELNKA